MTNPTDTGKREETVRVDCAYCGGSGVYEDDCTCMDDTCCCLEPTPPTCDECGGAGGYRIRSAALSDNGEG